MESGQDFKRFVAVLVIAIIIVVALVFTSVFF